MPKMGGDAMSSRQGTPTQVGAAPAARRLGSSRWRDPRLAVGIILVAASVVLGARVMASADDTVPVWSLRRDVSAGTPLTSGDVTVTRVHFESADDADRYFDGDQTVPSDLVAAHDLVAGELLAYSALTEPEDTADDQMTLPLTEGLYPPDLAPGDRVDVWVTPEDSTERQAVLKEVAVLDVDTAADTLDSTSTVVQLAVDRNDAAVIPDVYRWANAGSVGLLRKGD